MKRTYQPNVRRRKRKHGFRARMATRAGRAILKRRRARGRKRLSASRDFDVVYRRGSSVATRFLVLYRFPREDGVGDTRLGLAVPKSVGGAVTRNRLKRQLRDAWAALEAPEGSDYVLIARPGL